MGEYGAKIPIESIQDAYEYQKERIFHTIARLDEAESSLSHVIEILSKDGVTREALEGCLNSTQIKLLNSKSDIRNLLSAMYKRLSDFEIDQVIELDKKISENMRKEEKNNDDTEICAQTGGNCRS